MTTGKYSGDPRNTGDGADKAGSRDPSIDKGLEEDTPGAHEPDYADTNNRDIKAKQAEGVSGSEAMDDEEIDEDDVKVLPGTGGPDDVGHTEVDPDEINLPGTAGMHPS